jgi:polysaccharide export outer membrane protein
VESKDMTPIAIKKGRLRPAALLRSVVLSAIVASSSPLSIRAEDYKIDGGDVLAVTVYGDAGLSGAFPVAADGSISYPILGNIQVADKTTAEVGALLSSGLREHIANLSVSVAIKQYAPVFIVGDIQKPGQYDYRPGMIVLELFALGGGLRQGGEQVTNNSGVQLVAAQQDYDDTQLQLLSLDVRRARLAAEFNDKPFEYKTDGNPRYAAAIDSMVAAERSIYETRVAVQAADRANLEAQRDNYGEEIEMLEKGSTIRSQLVDLQKQDLDTSQGLVAKGAAPQAVLRDRQRDLLTMNEQALEGAAFLARAKQNKNEMERQLQGLDNKRKNDSAGELRTVSFDMERLRRKLEFILQSMAEIGAASQRTSTLQKTTNTEFSAMRVIDGKHQEVQLGEDSPVLAGDIVRIRLVPMAEAVVSQNSPQPGKN